jgi:hypothetical protein
MEDEKGLAALLVVLEAEFNTKGDMTLTTSGLMSRIRRALDPEVAKGYDRPAPVPQLPGPPPEFPKLKVRYEHGQPVEHVVCETIYEEVPYMSGGWYTRPLSELEQFRGAE